MLLTKKPPHRPGRRPVQARRPHRRRGRKFEPAIAASASSGSLRSPAERSVLEALKHLGITWHYEEVALRIVKTGRVKGRKRAGHDNGRHGWVTFDFRAYGVFIEVTEGNGVTKLDAIKFVEERYGFVVVLITGSELPEILDDPEALRRRIIQAKLLQDILRAGKNDAEVLEAQRATRKRRRQRRQEVRREQAERNAGSQFCPGFPGRLPLQLQASRRAKDLSAA